MTRIAIAATRGTVYHVEAAVFGDWAAHPCHRGFSLPGRPEDSAWRVTHVPSGRCAHSEEDLDESEALDIAAALSAEVPPLPVILHRDPSPELPIELMQRINDVFYGALKSHRDRRRTVDRSVGSDHAVERGAR